MTELSNVWVAVIWVVYSIVIGGLCIACFIAGWWTSIVCLKSGYVPMLRPKTQNNNEIDQTETYEDVI